MLGLREKANQPGWLVSLLLPSFSSVLPLLSLSVCLCLFQCLPLCILQYHNSHMLRIPHNCSSLSMLMKKLLTFSQPVHSKKQWKHIWSDSLYIFVYPAVIVQLTTVLYHEENSCQEQAHAQTHLITGCWSGLKFFLLCGNVLIPEIQISIHC